MDAGQSSARILYLHQVWATALQLVLLVLALAIHAIDRWVAVILLVCTLTVAGHASVVLRRDDG